MSKLIEKLVLRFRKDEDGIALTEYLILLGLLASAVITAVLLFGTELGDNWETWADWMHEEERLHAPAIEPAIGSGG